MYGGQNPHDAILKTERDQKFSNHQLFPFPLFYHKSFKLQWFLRKLKDTYANIFKLKNYKLFLYHNLNT